MRLSGLAGGLLAPIVRELGADSLSDPDVLGVFGAALQIAK
jgi:hypothetical protein